MNILQYDLYRLPPSVLRWLSENIEKNEVKTQFLIKFNKFIIEGNSDAGSLDAVASAAAKLASSGVIELIDADLKEYINQHDLIKHKRLEAFISALPYKVTPLSKRTFSPPKAKPSRNFVSPNIVKSNAQTQYKKVHKSSSSISPTKPMGMHIFSTKSLAASALANPIKSKTINSTSATNALRRVHQRQINNGKKKA